MLATNIVAYESPSCPYLASMIIIYSRPGQSSQKQHRFDLELSPSDFPKFRMGLTHHDATAKIEAGVAPSQINKKNIFELKFVLSQPPTRGNKS